MDWRLSEEEKALIEHLGRLHTVSKSCFLRELALSYAALGGNLHAVKVREDSEKILMNLRLLTAWFRLERSSFSEIERSYLNDQFDRLEWLLKRFGRDTEKFLKLGKTQDT